MFNLGPYPGINEDPDGVVYGELFELSNPEAATERLDQLEGYRKKTHSGMYLRERVEVELEDGSIEQAWVYIYNHKLPEERKIEKGVWEK